MVHHKSPHRNWQPPPRYQEKYKELKIPEPANLFDDYTTRTDAIREQHQSIARHLSKNEFKQEARDEDQFAEKQPGGGVDGRPRAK